jgi:hypothetical protein
MFHALLVPSFHAEVPATHSRESGRAAPGDSGQASAEHRHVAVTARPCSDCHAAWQGDTTTWPPEQLHADVAVSSVRRQTWDTSHSPPSGSGCDLQAAADENDAHCCMQSLLDRRAEKQTSLQTPSGHGMNAISRCCATRSGRQHDRNSSCAAVSSSWPTGPPPSSACRCTVRLKPVCFA